jgi:DNA processing protein
LIAEHGSAAAALEALPEVARASGVSDYVTYPVERVHAELDAGRRAGAVLVMQGASDYPRALLDIPDAPPMFWAMGSLALMQRPMVALVGARNASSLGTRMAKKLGQDLSDAGITVVSGLARGVDAAAHLGALKGGTIAVQAGGVDVIYPTENAGLAADIAKSGLRLSEMPMGMQPQARHFPVRNRIISGLAQAVVVVEAAAKSGSLITARNALDQGRDVLAVPGHPFDARAWGCNMLIRDGAALVRGVDDILASMANPAPETEIADVPHTPKAKPTLRQTAALHSEILARLGPSPVAEDQLVRDVNASACDVAPVLVDLELEGKILRQPGGLLSLAN